MKNLFLFLTFLFFSCSNSNEEMNINLSIDGFKKGNVYLQKIQDSALVNIDSVFVQNGDIIKLKHKISSPEIFYINLDISNSEKRIEFFGEKGDIFIKTNLKKFNSEFEISGSFNDSVYRNYLKIIKQFNYNRLDLIKQSINKSQKKELDSVIVIEEKIENLNKRQYLYSLNFAVTNSNSHVSPLIALNEFSKNKVLLDTIIKSLNKEILISKYGKRLKATLNKIDDL